MISNFSMLNYISKVLAIICAVSFSSHSFSQDNQEFIFFSNLDHLDQIDFLISQKEDASNQTWVSLGDNSPEVLRELEQKYTQSNHIYLLGDTRKILSKKDNSLKLDTDQKISCPEPLIIHESNNSVVITINSAWFVERELRFLSLDKSCNSFNEIQLIETLESVLEDYPDHQKIIVAHHNINSISEIAGKGLWAKNLVPFYGQLYNGYRKNVGMPGDFAHTNYQRYIGLIRKLLEDHENVVYISGHDHLNFVTKNNEATHLNVNSGSKANKYSRFEEVEFIDTKSNVLIMSHSNNKDGWTAEFVSQNGSYKDESLLNFEKYIDVAIPPKTTLATVSTTSEASKKYDRSKFTKWLMGRGYREEWRTPIEAELLNLDEYDNGLTPYDIGGGLQTLSIKFESGNGRKYAFRLLDKEPEKSLSDLFRESVYKNIVIELITTMHPYSPLVANHLLDQTDVLHIKPELFILNDHPSLTGRYAKYVGKLGTLELKPKGKSKKREGFAGADEVISTYEMLSSLRNSRNHTLDKMAYAKARLMDMYLGDWDRHEDNWKWAEFKDGKKHVYRPIPKDRDHVFSKWTGVVPKAADRFVPNAENFDYKFGNVRQLNFKGRFLDRELAGELSKADWLEAAKYLQSVLTDEAIDEATEKIPEEVRAVHGNEINSKLKSRREDLPNLVDKYYKELNPVAEIVGTNKKDKFKISSTENNDLLIKIYKKNEEAPYFQRIIECEEINNINLYGLAEDDEFIFDCDQTHLTTKIRVVGGVGVDKVTAVDNSRVPVITVYDTHREDDIQIADRVKINRPARVAHYDPHAFDYNFLSPTVTIASSSGNGFGFGAGINYFKRGFNKPDFDTKKSFKFVYFPAISTYRLNGKFIKTHFHKLLNLEAEGTFTTMYDKFPFFYGIGNDSPFIEPEADSPNRIDYDLIDFKIGLVKNFSTKSSWTNSVGFEQHNVVNFNDNGAIDPSIFGLGRETYYKLISEVKLDYTDNLNYPTDGALLEVGLTGRYNNDNNVTGNFDARFAYYTSIDIGILATFAGAVNFKETFGDAAFYHLSRLGSQSNFRGFTRNRFLDERALLLNAELRFRLGTVKTPFGRSPFGVYGFFDNGRVWNDVVGFSNLEWRSAFGGGIYLAPVKEFYFIKYVIATTDEESVYMQFEVGFKF